jgi:hypothetical protein
MHLSRKKLTVFVSAALAVGVVAGPQVGTAAAKTQKITMTIKGNKPGSIDDIRGKITSKQLGKGTQSGKVVLPNSFYTWKFKGGTLVSKGSGTLTGTKVKGKWKLTKGKSKGKFKGATGGGTLTGDIATGVFKFTGTIKY